MTETTNNGMGTLGAEKPTDRPALTLEAWAQGMMFGSLVIMAFVTIANMRKRVVLHKLILIELVFGMFQGTFIFPSEPAYGWYLSVGGVFLNISWSLHNVIAWMKVRSFLSHRISLAFIITVALAQPYWILEMTATFLYFNNFSNLFEHTRPYEALFRDPWWIFTTIVLFYNIKTRYEFGALELVRISPRMTCLMVAMVLSCCFILLDILSVVGILRANLPDGLNPFWKFAFIFKCLTDTLVLDDFQTALNRLQLYKMKQIGGALPPGDMHHVAAMGGLQHEKGLAVLASRPVTRHDSIWTGPPDPQDTPNMTFCTVPDDDDLEV